MTRVLFIAIALSLAACDDPPAPPATTTTASATSAAPVTTTTSSAKGPTYPDEAVPIPEDFEEQAEKDITPENYKDELAKESKALE